MELTQHVAFCMVVDVAVPVGRRIEEIIELLNAALNDLHYIVCGGAESAHVIAVHQEDAAILTRADQLVRMRRRIVRHDDWRAAAYIGIVRG